MAADTMAADTTATDTTVLDTTAADTTAADTAADTTAAYKTAAETAAEKFYSVIVRRICEKYPPPSPSYSCINTAPLPQYLSFPPDVCDQQ